MVDRAFEELIAGAERQPFSGWDFSYLQGRMREAGLGWDYADVVRRRLPLVDTVLDLGTGGGEVLSSLAPLPARTVATEAYPPNVEVARRRLGPLGVEIVAVEGAPDNVEIVSGEGVRSLPFSDESFPLVIDRHESYYPLEVHRILRGGGSFITQQVGGEHYADLDRALGAAPGRSSRWSLRFAVHQLEEAGLQIVERRESHPEIVFTDIGAVVYYLKAVPWQVPDFSVDRYRDRLRILHQRMEREGGLRVHGHFFLIEAVKAEARYYHQERREGWRDADQ